MEKLTANEIPPAENNVEVAVDYLDKVKELEAEYRKAPFSRSALLSAAFLAMVAVNNAEAHNSEEAPARLSTVELLEQTRELNNPIILEAVEALTAYQADEQVHGESVDWHAYTIDQGVYGDENWVNFQSVYPDIPKSGSGLLRMSSMISNAQTETQSEKLHYSGRARNINIQFDDSITPVSEPHTFEVTVSEADGINQSLMDGFVAEISERMGREVAVEGGVDTETSDGAYTTSYKSVLQSQLNHVIADWSIEQVDENTYTVTYRDGWVTDQESSQNIQPSE